MDEIKSKRGRPPVPKEYRELSQDLEETSDTLIDAVLFIEMNGLEDEWNIFKAEKYAKRMKERKK